jgi:hypothetical protein
MDGNQMYSANIDPLHFKGGVYAPDYAKRTLRKLYVPPTGQSVDAFSETLRSGDVKTQYLIVRTGSQLHILDKDGKELLQLALHMDPSVHGGVEVYAIPDVHQFYIEYSAKKEPYNANSDKPNLVERYSETGNLLGTLSLPPIPNSNSPRATILPEWCEPLGALGVPTMTVPVALVMAALQDPVFLESELRRMENDWRYILGGVCMLIGGLLCAGFAAGTCTRYAFPRSATMGWALFAFLFGVPGVLAFLALHDWPARVACPACTKKRVVTRDTCEHCAAPFPAAARNGTEIVELDAEAEATPAT